VTGGEFTAARWMKSWNLAKKAVAIEGITPYQLTRHSFASQLGNSDVPVQTIKNLLGHSNIDMTMRYTHSNIESMRTSIEKLSMKDKGEVVELKKKQEQH
jgi:site-specific recombinase XerD